MALLIDINDPEWMTDEQLRDTLRPLLPAVDIRCATEPGDVTDIVMLATVKLRRGSSTAFPNLQLVQKLGAGVETILDDPELPLHIRVARLNPPELAAEVTEYCIVYVLRQQRHLAAHEDNPKNRVWKRIPPRRASETIIGVLGLGHIGAKTAMAFRNLGFQVLGWSKSAKTIQGVQCLYGNGELRAMLSRCDYVICVLPSTPATRDLFGAAIFGAMKPSCVLINVGRGDLIVERDLLYALDNGQLSGVVLDVHRSEPLPKDHPYWLTPKITITPHVSGWHLDAGLQDIAENYQRLLNGLPLLHEVNRAAGY
jgi:glyoxylate/hydroxypyruvate reductase A